MTKTTLLKWCVGIIVVVAIVGAYLYPKVAPVRVGAVSSSGTYNGTTGLSQITFAPLTSSSTSILNTGASDRVVEELFVDCSNIGSSYTYTTGAGLLSTGWTLGVSTNQSAYASTSANMFYGVVATTTSPYLIASSTGSIQTASAFGSLSGIQALWPVNTYLVWSFDATNTTAVCSLTASWLPL